MLLCLVHNIWILGHYCGINYMSLLVWAAVVDLIINPRLWFVVRTEY
jgi:hypothetical protein